MQHKIVHVGLQTLNGTESSCTWTQIALNKIDENMRTAPCSVNAQDGAAG